MSMVLYLYASVNLIRFAGGSMVSFVRFNGFHQGADWAELVEVGKNEDSLKNIGPVKIRT